MVEVTQADREAAKRYFREADTSDVFHGTELAQAFARQRLAEREAVVKWLRRMQGNAGKWSPMEQIVAAACRYLADAIEAGGHRK